MKKIKNKYHKYVIFIMVNFILLIFPNASKAAYKLEGIENFPDDYKPYLYELQKKHSNWTFTALYTDLDWKYVIDNENIFGKNLVPKSYTDSWKNTKPGEYNVEVDAGWVDCSRNSLLYTMDPRNFLNEVRIFQFEGLSFNQNTNSVQGIEKILYGTEFYDKIVTYLTSSGNTITMNKKYSDLIYTAGNTSKVSAYHLSSRIKQEVGPFLSHSSISGKVAGYEGLYNFYNIGATSSAEPMGAIINGLKYARDGKGASEQTKAKFLNPWNTKERAITGGGIFIGSSYINIGQNTIYLQKFHVNDNDGGELFWHQYMTNVLAPYSESQSIYKGYKNSNLLDSAMEFIIPIYNNMEQIPQESPNIKESEYEKDNTKVYANVETTLNVRSGPGTNYESITLVNKNDIMTRIAKGKQAGELWDRVILENGIIGYVFQNYIDILPDKQIEKIEVSLDNNVINKNETKKLNIKIIPEDAKDQRLQYITSNSNVAQVDQNGNILGVNSGKVTITVKAIGNNVTASIDVEIYSKVTDIQVDVENITLQVGQTYQILANILPEDANNKNIKYTTSEESIVTINESGLIQAKNEGNATIEVASEENVEVKKRIQVKIIKELTEEDIKFDTNIKVNGNEITGINEDIRILQQLLNYIYINEKYELKIINKNGEELSNEDYVGTGTKIQLIEKENNMVVIEYSLIIYGDVNGDGKINSVDLLVLQRHILEIEKLDLISQKAGNINKDGKKPTSVDLLKIQRHILQIQEIEQ